MVWNCFASNSIPLAQCGSMGRLRHFQLLIDLELQMPIRRMSPAIDVLTRIGLRRFRYKNRYPQHLFNSLVISTLLNCSIVSRQFHHD